MPDGVSSPRQDGSRDKLLVPMAMIPRRKTVTVAHRRRARRVGCTDCGAIHDQYRHRRYPSTVQQCAALARAGSELVRVTVDNEEAAAAVPRIVEELDKQRHPRAHHRRLSLQRARPAHQVSRMRSRSGQVPDKPRHASIGRSGDSNFRTMIEVAVKYRSRCGSA